MKKSFARSTLVATATFVALGAHAGFSTKTHQAPPSVVISATKDANGNAFVTWTGPLKVEKAEHYVGDDGKSFGKPYPIIVGNSTRIVLKDIRKNGGAFNFIASDGLFLHLECGGNTETTEPTLKGVSKQCTEDEKTGQKVGRLVVN